MTNKQLARELRSIRSSLFDTTYDPNNKLLLDEAADRLENQGQWISVDERLPERAGEYVCCTKIRKVIMCEYLDYWSKGSRWDRRDITHWMPLPEAPKMKGGAE